MWLVDTNVLVYAVNTADERHAVAQEWLESALTGNETLAFAWNVLIGFLRISTHPRLLPSPLTAAQAGDVVRRWIDSDATVILDPEPEHLERLLALMAGTEATANLVNDAHLGALALEYGATVVTFDHDFERFEGVKWITPGA